MAAVISVEVSQIGLATSEGKVRQHSVLVDRPVAKEGEDRGAMGGELLLVSLGGCFMSNLLAAIKARSADVSDVRIEIDGTLESAPARFSAIQMTIHARYADRELLEKLMLISERACIVANTLKPAVDLTIRIDEPLAA
ncbi:MAG: OsmC family protein [Caldilineaceae bacterium]|nr:OsmC family protein [Caldilineaceae bacterium]